MNHQTDRLWVYCTTSSLEEARHIGKILVENKLAACVNILPQMQSIYQWQGKIEEGQETVLIAKTTTQCWSKLKDTIIENHSYECPCVVALPIVNGHSDFLDWIGKETKH
jgi:periplasmic divalent cation tolerance protein